MKIRINGKEYDWGTIKIIMWGRPVVGATSVDYKLTKAKEALYAAGRYAKGIQHGQRAASGTLTLLQSEIIAMNRAAREKGYKDILDVDVDILISYIPEDSTAITVDQIICASFSELPSGMMPCRSSLSTSTTTSRRNKTSPRHRTVGCLNTL